VQLFTDDVSMTLDADADAGGYDSWCQGSGRVSFPARIHVFVQKFLMFELARRGYEVTVVSSFPENKAIPNYTDI
jgi:hypothetical protein